MQLWLFSEPLNTILLHRVCAENALVRYSVMDYSEMNPYCVYKKNKSYLIYCQWEHNGESESNVINIDQRLIELNSSRNINMHCADIVRDKFNLLKLFCFVFI